MKLNDFAVVKTNELNADFWVVRRGSVQNLGSSTYTFNPEHFGITVVETGLVLSDWLYYVFKHLNQSGYFLPLARGTLNLQHITKKDIENIQFRRQG